MAYGILNIETIASGTAATPPTIEDNASREIGQFCTAWCSFDGSVGTPTPDGSFNVSSITDSGVGDYNLNFATAMTNINYAANTTVNRTTTDMVGGSVNSSITYVRILTYRTHTEALADASYISVAIHGGL